MKTKVQLLLYVILLAAFFSSCSSSRYGRIPKVKAQKKTVAQKTQPTKAKQKEASTAVLPLKSLAEPVAATIEIKQQAVAIEPPTRTAKTPSINTQKEDAPKTVAQKQKTAETTQKVATQKTQRQYRSKKSFWDTEFGDFVLKLIFLSIELGFVLLIYWLIQIGLGWLAAIILIVLAILIIMALVDVLSDICDALGGIFFWGH